MIPLEELESQFAAKIQELESLFAEQREIAEKIQTAEEQVEILNEQIKKLKPKPENCE